MQPLRNTKSFPTAAPRRAAAGLGLGLALVGGGWLASQAARLSGLALAVGLLTLFVAVVVAAFAQRYMRGDQQPWRFFLRFAALVAAVLAFVTAGNLLVLGAAWCASGWLLAALIGHAEGWPEAAAAARRTRLSFALGDAALLGALALLGHQAHGLRLDGVLAAAPQLPPMTAAAAALLLLVAAAARCALPPFSGWLLSSMTAPTPVSALMHAGLVNAGGFLLIRFAPVLEAAPGVRVVAVGLGLYAALYGAGIMLVRPDVKRSLAGSTISQMGFMIMSCGLGAYAAALWHIIAHGLFKAWLFLGSGSAVGMKAGKPALVLSAGQTAAICALTAALALAWAASGGGDAEMVPLLLGAATAAAMLGAFLRGGVPARARAAIAGGLGALALLHSAGLSLAKKAVGPLATHPAPPVMGLVVLFLFLGAWAWQQQRIASGRGFPLRLYVYLINAGALPAAAPGAKQ